MSADSLPAIPKSSRQRRKLAAIAHNAGRVTRPAARYRTRPKNDGLDEDRLFRAEAKRARKAAR